MNPCEPGKATSFGVKRSRGVSALSRRRLIASISALAVCTPFTYARSGAAADETKTQFLFSLQDSVRVYRDQFILTHLDVDEEQIVRLKQFADVVVQKAELAKSAARNLQTALRSHSSELGALHDDVSQIQLIASRAGAGYQDRQEFLSLMQSASDGIVANSGLFVSSGQRLSTNQRREAEALIQAVKDLTNFIDRSRPDISTPHMGEADFRSILSNLDEAELEFDTAYRAIDSKAHTIPGTPHLSDGIEAHPSLKRGVRLVNSAALTIRNSGSPSEAPFATMLLALSDYALKHLAYPSAHVDDLANERAEVFTSSMGNAYLQQVIGVRQMIRSCGYVDSWAYAVAITSWVVPLNAIIDKNERRDRIGSGIRCILRVHLTPGQESKLIDLLYQALIWFLP